MNALPVNVRGALVHRSSDGLLLASPGIFRAFIRREAPVAMSPATLPSDCSAAPREPAGTRRTDGGVNLHGYAWRHGRARGRSHPRRRDPRATARFVDPVPPINLALVARG